MEEELKDSIDSLRAEIKDSSKETNSYINSLTNELKELNQEMGFLTTYLKDLIEILQKNNSLSETE